MVHSFIHTKTCIYFDLMTQRDSMYWNLFLCMEFFGRMKREFCKPTELCELLNYVGEHTTLYFARARKR